MTVGTPTTHLFFNKVKWIWAEYFAFLQAAIYGRDPNWGRIACAAGKAGVLFDENELRISLGDIALMESGQPLPFDRLVILSDK